MPELGESVHEGTVSRWLKKEGDFVKEDEPVVEIMTDKVNTELGAPASGILTKIIVPEGGLVEVFSAMGIIDDGAAAGDAPAPAAAPPAAEKTPAPATPTPVASSAPTTSGSSNGGDRRWYSPVVRSMAKQHNLSDADLARIQGSGEGGRVNKKDVEAFLAGGVRTAAPSPALEVKAPSVPVTAGPGQTVTPLAGMRKMIADAMVRSAAVPTVSTLTEVDVTPMVKFRERNKDSFPEQFGVKLTYTPFFIKAITDALLEFPLINSSLQDGQIIQKRRQDHCRVRSS